MVLSGFASGQYHFCAIVLRVGFFLRNVPFYFELIQNSADTVYCGKAEEIMKQIVPDSIAVSVWPPPYPLGR